MQFLKKSISIIMVPVFMFTAVFFLFSCSVDSKYKDARAGENKESFSEIIEKLTSREKEERVLSLEVESADSYYVNNARPVLSMYSDINDRIISKNIVSRKEWIELFIDVFDLWNHLDDSYANSIFACTGEFDIADEKDMFLADSFRNDPYVPLLRKEAGDTIVQYLGYPLQEYNSRDSEKLKIQTNLATALYYGFLYTDEDGNANPEGIVNYDDYERIRDDLCKYLEFKGKVLFSYGDSIMAGDGNNGVGIANLIAEKYKMDLKDFSMGGCTFEHKDEKIQIYRQIIYSSCIDESPDFIIINGGTNDLKSDNAGTVMDDMDFDYISNGNNSFAAGMEYCFGLLRDRFPSVKKLFIRCHQMAAYDELKQEKYGQMSLKICEKWDIPYVDIYNDSGFDGKDGKLVYQYTYRDNNKYKNGDSIHPVHDMYLRYYIPSVTDSIYVLMNESDDTVYITKKPEENNVKTLSGSSLFQ